MINVKQIKKDRGKEKRKNINDLCYWTGIKFKFQIWKSIPNFKKINCLHIFSVFSSFYCDKLIFSAFLEGLEARSILGRLYGVFRICMVDALMKNFEARGTLSTSHGALEITNFPVFSKKIVFFSSSNRIYRYFEGDSMCWNHFSE